MYSAPDQFATARRLSRSVALLSLVIAGALHAAQPIPANLGNGLNALLQTKVPAYFNSQVQEQGNAVDAAAIKDSQGRVLVRINPSGDTLAGRSPTTVNTLVQTLPNSIPSLSITAVDNDYRGVGVMNAFVDLADVPVLASSPGVRSVILEWKPRHAPMLPADTDSLASGALPSATPGETLRRLGTTFDQGVTQHGIDQINQFYNSSAPLDWEGAGMSIGFISNSYAANAASPASIDVTNFDVPGDPANPINTQPVVVLQDDLTSSTSDDEGRGMIQIGYKMAPKARLAFATADTGEVGFANNIRALAGMPGFVYSAGIQQGFAADTICDDVGYFDEPFFQDGIIGAGVNDATAFGVAYFSSAANDIGTNGYESEIRLVPNGSGVTSATNTALLNTNINLTGVPTNLYAGGFHNFNPVPGQLDVAQLVNIAANNTVPTTLEWNDPYDQNGGVALGAQIYTNTGTYVATPVVFDNTSAPPLPVFVAGQAYQIIENATGGANYDAVVTIIKPDSTILLTQDTGIDETVNFTAPVSGQYKISFDHFGATTGTFAFTVYKATVTPLVVSDWNLLAFNTTTGAYLPASSLTTDNLATNEPVELGYTNRPSGTTVQYVFARSNTPPPGARVADRIRYLLPGNGRAGYGPAEYFSYNTVTTGGHAMAKGTNGMAAYSVFRPSLPETFTSPGPVRIYFDASGNALQLPEIRQEPRLGAADGANVSANLSAVFAGDTSADLDTQGNFFGTSAAGPHAAAIAALVLEAHGGRHSITPTQMTNLLERTTLVHDLDPSYASGSARNANGDKVTITINSDGSATNTAGTGLGDNNSISVTYTGAGNLNTLVFNPAGTAATAGNASGGNNGYQDVTPPTIPATLTYFENSFPGMVFMPATKAFTVGSKSTIPQASATATYTNVAPLPSNGTTQVWTMTLTFDTSFTDGKVLSYNVARGVQHSASTTGGIGAAGGTTSASYLGDLLGGGVSIPSGTITLDGMTFSGTTSNGPFTGVIRNRLARGYSPVDGYGFIDAHAAVQATP